MKILVVARASISKPSFYRFLKTIPSRQLRDTAEFSEWDYLDKGERFQRKSFGFGAAYLTLGAAMLVWPAALTWGILRRGKIEEDIQRAYKLYNEHWMKIPSEEAVAQLKRAAKDFINEEKNANKAINSDA